MSVQTDHPVGREFATSPVVPGWAEEDWEVTIDRFLGSVDDLPADVGKFYRMLSGAPERGTLRSFGDVWEATCSVLFNPNRLAEFLMEINPRVVELWK